MDIFIGRNPLLVVSNLDLYSTSGGSIKFKPFSKNNCSIKLLPLPHYNLNNLRYLLSDCIQVTESFVSI